MFTKKQLEKALKSIVIPTVTTNSIWFDVIYYDSKNKRHKHSVRFDKRKDVSIKEKFTCDCSWWTHKVQFNRGQLCYHIIAAIIKMAELKWIDKYWLAYIFDLDPAELKDNFSKKDLRTYLYK